MRNLILGLASATALASCEPIEINTTDAVCLRYEAWESNVEIASGEINAITLSNKQTLLDSIGVHYNADSVWGQTFFCIEEQGLPTEGEVWYNVTFKDVQYSGWAGGWDGDTCIEDLCLFAFDNGVMTTLDTGLYITDFPILGNQWTGNIQFAIQNNIDSVIIGNEPWGYAKVGGQHTLNRFTDYFGMGSQVTTLILTEL
jgi:hypothetical protein